MGKLKKSKPRKPGAPPPKAGPHSKPAEWPNGPGKNLPPGHGPAYGKERKKGK